MAPNEALVSVGFEQDISYTCLWGTLEKFSKVDQGGFIYILQCDQFEKVGKEYEWQSFSEVKPIEVKKYSSVLNGMIENNVQVYFINDNDTFDEIVENKNHRAPILKHLVSENQKRLTNVKRFD